MISYRCYLRGFQPKIKHVDVDVRHPSSQDAVDVVEEAESLPEVVGGHAGNDNGGRGF